MKKKVRISRRILSLLLAVIMIASVIPLGMLEASALDYSSSYRGSSYYTELRKVTITGNQREDIVKIAESQIGYASSAEWSYDYSGSCSPAVEDGTNEYSRAMGCSSGFRVGGWCADFVSWCARVANIPTSTIKSSAGASPEGAYFNIPYERSKAYGGNYTPKRGDLIFFNWTYGSSGYSHVGIVSSVSGNNVTFVDGNGGSTIKVRKNTYALDNTSIKAYGIPKYTNNPTSTSSSSQTNTNNYPDANKIVNLAKSKSGKYAGEGAWCLAYCQNLFIEAYGWGYKNTSNHNSAYQYATKSGVRKSQSRNNIPLGALVFFSDGGDGHVGIYVGDNKIIHTARQIGSSASRYWYYQTIDTVERNLGCAYCGWGWMGNQPLSSAVQIPKTPTNFKSSVGNVAAGDTVLLSWDAVSGATSYLVDIWTRGVQYKCYSVNGTATSFVTELNEANSQNYDCFVYAVNSAGRSGNTKVSLTTHPKLTVTFKNWDGTDQCTQKVKYGYKPVAPEAPEREGYTFNGWDGADNAVYQDTVINAKYTRNRYLVNFYKYVKNADGTRSAIKLGDTQKVWYGENAIAPDSDTFDLPSGHVFASWSDSFENIKENKNIYLVDKWYNENMKIIVSDLVATRDDEGTGYTVTLKVTNNDSSITSGRVIVALKTGEEKLVETTESSAFSLKAGKDKTLEIFIPSTKAASIVDAYAVEKFETAIPISVTQRANIVVDEDNLWTDWSTEAPPEDALNTQTKTQYKTRSKQFVYNGYTSLEGYTTSGRTLKGTSESGWTPWGQSYSNSSDANYYYERSQQTKSAYYSWAYTTDKQNYYYYTPSDSGYTKFWRIYSSAAGSTAGSDNNHAYVNAGKTLTTKGYDSQLGTIYCMTIAPKSNINSQSIIGSFTSGASISVPYKGGTSTIYKVVTNKYQYTHWKWGDWSDWGDIPANSTDLQNQTAEQETRRVFRYIPKSAVGIEDNSGVQRNINGVLSSDYAGQQATLFVYKYDEASDWTNEYVGQCEIGTDGSYNFDFILRDEPTVKTGDYTVTLGIEGTDTVIYLNPIKAPVEQFTVNYYNVDGTIASTQIVNKGSSAIIPDFIPEKEGYTFTGWSESNTNIKENLDIFPEFKINTYDVVFINWETQSYETRTFNYGDSIDAPVAADTEDKAFVGWDIVINDGVQSVTSNLVACVVYETKQFSVKFYDWDDALISEQTVPYGESAVVPELTARDGYNLDGWSTYDFYYATSDLEVRPVFHFDNTVDIPTASVDTGVYDENQTVTLACATDGAQIFYTVDGSDPAQNGVLYTAPVSIEKSTVLRFIAKKTEYNNSEEVRKCYALNKDDMDSEWMAFNELPEDVVNNPGDYSMLSATGYKYKNTIDTQSLSHKELLLSNNWTVESEDWTDWSDYSETYPVNNDGIIEVESKDADPVEQTFYNYSHYKYVDPENGNTVITADEVEGTNGQTETLKLDNALNVNSFVGGKPAYLYNGELWFNQTTTSEFVDPGFDVYRYRTKIFNLFRWTQWTTSAPTAGEAREYVSDTVFRYTIPNEYVVTIDYSISGLTDAENKETLVRQGNIIGYVATDFELEEWDFDGLYTDSQFANEWDMDADTVSENETLYAKYTMKTFTVQYLDYDDSVISEQTVQYMSGANIPDDPARDGYVFIGWETVSGTEGIDGVISDLIYRAKYVAEEDYVRVSLSRSRISLMTGSSAKLTVTLSSINAVDSEVYLYSSNPEIATVDAEGNVTAVHSGTAVITALSLDTYESANCVVTVLGTVDTEILPISNSGVIVDPSTKYLLGINSGENTIDAISSKLENPDLIFTNSDKTVVYDQNKTIVGTGCKVQLKDGLALIDEVTIVVNGDVNGDGAVDGFDAIEVGLSNNGAHSIENEYAVAADVSGDGELSSVDYALLVQIAIGKA